MIIHYNNLSNGHTQCLCQETLTQNRRFVRIQSTQLEQSLYEHVLYGFGPDFLMNLACSHSIIVHDSSERPRLTRALRQGIPWIWYVCNRLWFPHIPINKVLLLSRRPGHITTQNMTKEFSKHFNNISPSTRSYIAYYRQFTTDRPIQIGVRDCKTGKEIFPYVYY